MPTECSAKPMGFARVDGRAVVADFDGGAITSNAGGLPRAPRLMLSGNRIS